jgi:outer membrane receptor protein involved in Fe transport
MFRQSMTSYAVQLTLLASLSSTAAVAQTPSSNEDSATAVERIQVTSSRISREGAVAPTPITAISGEELIKTGATNIGEALNELPALASTFSLANSGGSIGNAGLNLLDLRAMGANRTLVLVDGRRHVASSAGSASVDVNTIPTAWIDSVEIITGGASAIYGADAVTGVVNFRLKKDITGFNFDTTLSKAQDNPYQNKKASVSYGEDFANGNGNFAFAAEYATQDSVNATKRSKTRTPYMEVRNPKNGDKKDPITGATIHDGIPDRITVANTGWYDSSINGNFQANDGTWYIFDANGALRAQNLGTTYGEYGRCSNCEYLNLVEYADLQPNFDRLALSSKTNYDLTNDINLSFDVKHVVSKGTSENQPSFFEYDTALPIQRDNAYMSPTLAAFMDKNGLESIAIHRFNKDAGRRFEENTRTTDRAVINVTGQINDDWSFDSFATYGTTKLEQINKNNLIRKNFAQSIDAILVNGQAVCRDTAARAAGCVPTSLFGPNAINDGARQWFNTTSVSDSRITQQVAGASVANSALFDLPAGGLGVAAGVEYRKEESESKPDAFAATGATFLNALQYEYGSFNVREAYAEVSVPLLTDLPLIQDLVIDGAVRAANYSSTGDAVSWKSGLDWSLSDELRVRSTYAIALRAPNIGELYGPQNQTFFRVNDPCGKEYNQSATRGKNCAALGIPANFDPTATASTIEGLSGGNPNLDPEESTSYTVGFVYQPEFFEDLMVTVDYWNIEIDDAIDSVSAQNILDKCVDSPSGLNTQFCNLIKRDAVSKELKLITSITQNVAKQSASGVDFEFAYDIPLFGGELKTSLIGTYLDSRKEFSFQDNPSEFDENAGSLGEAVWQENLKLSYQYDAWFASYRLSHLDAVSLYNANALARNPDPSDIMGYGSYFLSDLSAGYAFDNGVTLTFGIDNLFDRDLPGVTTGTGTGSASYDNLGRLFYTSVAFRM